MRKTLLIAASALGASVISSQAGVYSQNIVGYVNQPMNVGYNAISVPLDLAGGNYLTNIIPNPVAGGDGGPNGGSGQYDFTQVSVYNGVSFTVYTLDSDYSTGVGNQLDNAPASPNPVVNPGTLFFFNQFGNSAPAPFTNTFVGTVHVDAAATGSQTVGSTTNNYSRGNNFFASKLPIGGGVSSVLNLTNLVVGGDGPSAPNAGTGPLDFAQIEIPNLITFGTVNGYPQYIVQGYNVTTIDSDYTTGFANQLDNAQASEPQIPVGSGFILNTFSANSPAGVWNQGF